MGIQNIGEAVGMIYSALYSVDESMIEIQNALVRKNIALEGFPRSVWPDIINDYSRLGVNGIGALNTKAQSSRNNVNDRFALARHLHDSGISISTLNIGGDIDLGWITEGLLRYGVTGIESINVNGGDWCEGSTYGKGFGYSIQAKSVNVISEHADVGFCDLSSCEKVSVTSTGSDVADLYLSNNKALTKAIFKTENSGVVRESVVTVRNCPNMKRLEAYGKVNVEIIEGANLDELHITANESSAEDRRWIYMSGKSSTKLVHHFGTSNKQVQLKGKFGRALDGEVFSLRLNSVPEVTYYEREVQRGYSGCIEFDVHASISDGVRQTIICPAIQTDVGSLVNACPMPSISRNGNKDICEGSSNSVLYQPVFYVDLAYAPIGEYVYSSLGMKKNISLRPSQSALSEIKGTGYYSTTFPSQLSVRMSASAYVRNRGGVKEVYRCKVLFDVECFERRGGVHTLKDGTLTFSWF